VQITSLGFRPAAVVEHSLDAVLFADVEVPGIAGRVTAGFPRILNLTETRFPQPVLIGNFCIPLSVTVALVSQ